MTNNAMPLSLTSDTFNALKTDFDLVLRRLLKTMELKGADQRRNQSEDESGF